MRRKENERNRKLPPASRTKAIVSEPSSRYAVPAVMRETLMPAMARNLGGRRLYDGGRSDEVWRRADVEQTIEGRDARRSHASAIHDGRLRLRIPARTAGRGAELRPRRQRFGNERDSSRVCGVRPVGDRVVQPGQSLGFAPGRLAPRPHAAQVEDRSGSRTVAQSLWPARGNRRGQKFPKKC